MTGDLLWAEADRLGVETSFTDVHGVTHRARPEAVRAVVEVLRADRTPEAGIANPVHVMGRAARHPQSENAATEVVRTTARVIDARLLSPAHPLAPRRGPAPGEFAVTPSADGTGVVLPGDLPVGCHTLEIDTAAGSTRVTVIRPPATMDPRALDPVPAWVGGSSLFVPTYALWEPDTPLASYGLLGRLTAAVGALGVDLVATLPLYAMFLDEPHAPSPYSPVSRLHWNEVLISEHLLHPPGVEPPPVDLASLTLDGGRHVDWAALGARRRAQLRQLVDHLDPPTRAAVQAFVADRPDVAAFARFMAARTTATATATATDIDIDPAREARSHELAQYLAHTELAAIARGPGARLALDLPVGCHPEGFERRAHPELFAEAMSIGAPPDLLFDGGQDWGLPPMLPGALRASGYGLWRDLVTRAGEHAALVRIDHVMALHRLWWIPAGMDPRDGVYVRYPRTEMFAMLAATAAAVGTCVVGEDLGTVPPEVHTEMAHWGMLGMYEEAFHLGDRPLASIPARSVAGLRTHDMTPLRALHDDDPALLTAYHRELADPHAPLLDAILERLRSSPATLVQIDLDDLCEVAEPHNLPGQVLATLWSRRLERPLGATLADPDLRRRLVRWGRRRDPGAAAQDSS